MNIKYNRTGNERKALVKALSEIIGAMPKYLGAPSFAYTVDGYAVDRDGTLTNQDGHGDPEAFERIGSLLSMKGFDGEVQGEATAQGEQPGEGDTAEDTSDVQAAPTQPTDEPQPEPDEAPTPAALESSEYETEPLPTEPPTPAIGTASAIDNEPTSITLQLPLADMTDTQLLNLQKLIASKAMLIRKALGIDNRKDLRFLIDGDNEYVVFPWLDTQPDGDTLMTFMRFISALCKTAKTQKRVNGTEHEVESEKFAFRIFLVRLGMSGPSYAADRKALLANLSGNAAFPNNDKARDHAAKWKNLRQQARADNLANHAEDESSTVAAVRDDTPEVDTDTNTDTDTDTE